MRVNKEYKDLFADGFKANDTSPKYSFDIRMEENTSGIGTINNEASVEYNGERNGRSLGLLFSKNQLK